MSNYIFFNKLLSLKFNIIFAYNTKHRNIYFPVTSEICTVIKLYLNKIFIFDRSILPITIDSFVM